MNYEIQAQESQRLSWIDIMKGIGIILVIIGHVYRNVTVYNWIYSFHLPVFFFCGGWLYRKKDIFTFIKRRFFTIIVPYFTFGILIFTYWAVIERRFRVEQVGVADSFFGLLRGQYDLLNFNIHLWFLPCFFMTVIIYNIMMNLIGRRNTYIVAAAMSFVYAFVTLPELPWGINRIFRFIGFYALGNALAEVHAERYVLKQPRWVEALTAAVLLGGNFVISYFFTGYVWFAAGIVGVIGCMFLSFAIRRNRALQYLGSISLVVLCIHGPIYRVLIVLISLPLHMNTETVRENFILVIVVVAITLLITSLVYEVLLRIAPWAMGQKRKIKES